MAINIESLLPLIQASDTTKEASKLERDGDTYFELDDDGEEYTGIGINGLLAASEKILAVNNGLAEPDERDSLRFKKIGRFPNMLHERIKMDSGKTARQLLYQAAKRRNLSAVHSFAFDPYVSGVMVGNPLTTPLEEINPMQLVESARRVTLMGPGGLGSSRSITADSQNVHSSQFGFISPLEAPESEKAGIDTRISWGTTLGSNGRFYEKFRDVKTGKLKWMSPEDVASLTIKIPD